MKRVEEFKYLVYYYFYVLRKGSFLFFIIDVLVLILLNMYVEEGWVGVMYGIKVGN